MSSTGPSALNVKESAGKVWIVLRASDSPGLDVCRPYTAQSVEPEIAGLIKRQAQECLRVGGGRGGLEGDGVGRWVTVDSHPGPACRFVPRDVLQLVRAGFCARFVALSR